MWIFDIFKRKKKDEKGAEKPQNAIKITKGKFYSDSRHSADREYYDNGSQYSNLLSDIAIDSLFSSSDSSSDSISSSDSGSDFSGFDGGGGGGANGDW